MPPSYVATALTVYGIETGAKVRPPCFDSVATALTVYGIETCPSGRTKTSSSSVLQQPLPFTVLKQAHSINTIVAIN